MQQYDECRARSYFLPMLSDLRLVVGGNILRCIRTATRLFCMAKMYGQKLSLIIRQFSESVYTDVCGRTASERVLRVQIVDELNARSSSSSSCVDRLAFLVDSSVRRSSVMNGRNARPRQL